MGFKSGASCQHQHEIDAAFAALSAVRQYKNAPEGLLECQEALPRLVSIQILPKDVGWVYLAQFI